MINYNSIIKETDYIVNALREEFSMVNESGAIDEIFTELKKHLNKVTMLPNNAINAKAYQEHEVVDGFKKMGFEYKKPMGKKLLFFNKKTSISLYLGQENRIITLLP